MLSFQPPLTQSQSQGHMSWGLLQLHPLPDTNFCICYLLLYNKTLQNVVVSNNHNGFYLIILWIGWGVLPLLPPGLQSTGRLASPGLFSPERPPSWVHKHTSVVVLGQWESKSGGSKASRSQPPWSPNVTSTIFYWSNEVTKPGHSQRLEKHTHLD